MGGFAGGDEGGFWDEDIVLKSTNKNNNIQMQKEIRCTIVQNNHYTLRFVSSATQELCIEPKKIEKEVAANIYKAYEALIEYTNDPDIQEFFLDHKIVFEQCLEPLQKTHKLLTVTALFLSLVQDACSLILTAQELQKIENKL